MEGDPDKGAKITIEIPEQRQSPGSAHITLERFNTATRNVLRKFDDNGDGRIDATEIEAVVSTLVAEQFKSKAFRVGLIALAVFTVILLAATFGLTWAVVAVLKDTRVQGGVLVTNDASRSAVMTASKELLVQRGRLVERGPDGASTGNVLSTAAYRGRAAISPEMPMDVLMGVQTLVLSTPGGGEVALSVQAISRVPSNSSGKHVLKLQTPAGLLVVAEDGSLAVQGEPGQLLKDAGFTTVAADGGTGRRLLEALRFYVYCSTQDCVSWTADLLQTCGGSTGISCDAVAADDEYMFVDTPPPPNVRQSSPPPPADNSGSGGAGTGCGVYRTTDSCLSAAELCFNSGRPLPDTSYLDTIAKLNLKCQQTECNNGLIWGWNTKAGYELLSGQVVTVSYCAGSRTFTFCCGV